MSLFIFTSLFYNHVYYFFLCFFFFSSRRRHTRSLCDWSSDVCSSDLGGPIISHVLDLASQHVHAPTRRCLAPTGVYRSRHQNSGATKTRASQRRLDERGR